jgi:hypothetical protein
VSVFGFQSSVTVVWSPGSCVHRSFTPRAAYGYSRGPSQAIKWFRIRHSVVGGPTNFCALLGTTDPVFEPKLSVLRRTIRSVIDFGLRPLPHNSSTCKSRTPTKFYSLDDKLITGHYHRPVVLPTHFYANGLGHRVLTNLELGKAHGFPTILANRSDLDPTLFTIPPIKILDAIVAGLPVVQPCKPPAVIPSPPVPIAACIDEHRSWLPSIRRFLPHTWIDVHLVTTKAQKHDKALVPAHLWDSWITLLFPDTQRALDLLRSVLLRRYRRSIFREVCAYLRTTFGLNWPLLTLQFRNGRPSSDSASGHTTDELLSDIVAIQLIMKQLSSSIWWEWEGGSSLLFWRWGQFQDTAKNGMEPFVVERLPTTKRRARRPTADKFNRVAEKLKTIVERGYVQPGFVLCLTDYFDVPKGDDIRIIYNGSSCGLNGAVWAPSFWLPYPRTALRLLDYNFYSVDMDLGEMFLNFPLHVKLQLYFGIDLTPFKKELDIPPTTSGWFKWTRNWMGARSRPYVSVRYFYLAEEFCRGFRSDKNNPLQWDCIILNLPGSKSYDPSKPRVFKWDSVNQRMAGDLITFVDDLRITGFSVEQSWQIARLISYRLQYLGIQDASRKRRPLTRSPGAWAGAIFEASLDHITKNGIRRQMGEREVIGEHFMGTAQC